LKEKIIKLLNETGKTPYLVSKETGISQSSFSNWKNTTREPGLKTLIILSEYFDVPLSYFLRD
jgi:transcriptional regulator with XRE-family HTH domain